MDYFRLRYLENYKKLAYRKAAFACALKKTSYHFTQGMRTSARHLTDNIYENKHYLSNRKGNFSISRGA